MEYGDLPIAGFIPFVSFTELNNKYEALHKGDKKMKPSVKHGTAKKRKRDDNSSKKKIASLKNASKYRAPAIKACDVDNDPNNFDVWLSWSRDVWTDVIEKRNDRLRQKMGQQQQRTTSSRPRQGKKKEDTSFYGWNTKKPPSPHTQLGPLTGNSLRMMVHLWDFICRFQEALGIHDLFTFDTLINAMYTVEPCVINDQVMAGLLKFICTKSARKKSSNALQEESQRAVLNVLTWQEVLRQWLVEQVQSEDDNQISWTSKKLDLFQNAADLLGEENYYILNLEKRLLLVESLLFAAISSPAMHNYADKGIVSRSTTRVETNRLVDKDKSANLILSKNMSLVANCLSDLVTQVEKTVPEIVSSSISSEQGELEKNAIRQSKSRTTTLGLNALGKQYLINKHNNVMEIADRKRREAKERYSLTAIPLGSDRYYNRYWIMGGIAATNSRIFVEYDVTSDVPSFGYYDSQAEIKKLMSFCDVRGDREFNLKNALEDCSREMIFAHDMKNSLPSKRINGLSGVIEKPYDWQNITSTCKYTLRASKVVEQLAKDSAPEIRCDGCQESYVDDEEFHCPRCHQVIDKLKKISTMRMSHEIEEHEITCKAKEQPAMSSEIEEQLKEDAIEHFQEQEKKQEEALIAAQPVHDDDSVIPEVIVVDRWWTGAAASKYFNGSSYFKAMNINEVSPTFKAIKACIFDIESAIPVEGVVQHSKKQRDRWIDATKHCYSLPGLCERLHEVLNSVEISWVKPWFGNKIELFRRNLKDVKTESQLSTFVFQLDSALVYTWEDKGIAQEEKNYSDDDVIHGCHACGGSERPEETLVCDECEHEYHMFCLSPPLKRIPRGDWFCNECKQNARKRSAKHSNKRRKNNHDDDDDDSDDMVDEAPPTPSLIDQQYCGTCQNGHNNPGNEILLCDSCDKGFHMQCLITPLHSIPRGDWFCDECAGGYDKNDDDEMEDDNYSSSANDSDDDDEQSNSDNSSSSSDSSDSDEESDVGMCNICATEADYNAVICDKCSVVAHKECLGLTLIPKAFTCVACEKDNKKRTCVLCPIPGGMLTKIDQSGREFDGKYAHYSCALFLPQVSYGDIKRRKPIIGVNDIDIEAFTQNCIICKSANGACLTCAERRCTETFHVSCATSESSIDLGYKCFVGKLKKKRKPDTKIFCPKHAKNGKL